MEKQECKEQYEKRELIMSDEKWNECPLLYECRYMIAEMNEIVYGD